MDFLPIVNKLFEGDFAWYNYHDTVFCVTGVSHSSEVLKELFLTLPWDVQQTALEWGLSDTVFNDQVYVYLTKELARTKQV